MKKRILTLLLCLVMLFSCVGAGIDAITDDSETVPFADETPVAPVDDTNAADAEASPAPEATPAPADNATALSSEEVNAAINTLMTLSSEEEMLAYLSNYTEAQQQQIINSISNEQLQKLAAKADVALNEVVITPAKNYTDVGELMPPVNIKAASSKKLLKASGASTLADTGDSGLNLNKTAVPDGKGGYKITLEAYTTGVVSSVTQAVPADIVLVLDESGSMSDSMYEYSKVYITKKDDNSYYVKRGDSFVQVKWCGGLLTHSGGWYTGVHFLGHWGTRYDPMTSATDKNSSHYQFYTRSETTTTKNAALKAAATAFVNNVYNDAVNNNVDHRISVIGFSADSNIKIGLVNDIRNNKNDVLNAVNGLETSGGTYIEKGMANAKKAFDEAASTSATTRNRVVIVFTDGIPGNGSWSNTTITGSANPAISTSNTLKNDYKATVYTIGMLDNADPELDIQDDSDDSARTNKFLHYLSSNFPNATSMSAGGSNGSIDKGCYLSASDTASLNAIFKKISSEISTPTINLGSNTVIKDTVTKYFDMPADTSKVSVKTVNCTSYDAKTGAAKWASTSTALKGAAVSIDGNAVNVTGFDFDSNYISEKAKTDGSYGKKLVIEFTVTPKDGFAGGNNVPTNGSESGIYENKDATTPVDTFEIPTVNVPVIAPALTAKDSNIYYDGSVPTAEGMCNSYDTTSYLFDFVNVSYDLDKAVSNTADGSYTVTATVEPKEKASSTSVGSEATAKTASASAKVNVFKPEITFKDSAIDLGETAKYTDNGGTVVWKHGATSAETVTMTGSAPTLTFSYDPIADAFKVDTYVNVNVKNGDKDITNAVTFKHDTCNFDKCSFDEGKGEFIVHIKTFDLTISKKGWDTVDENQSFVFRIVCAEKGVDMQVTVIGNDSVTVKGLPVGTYTVTEDTAWAWRYNLQGVENAFSGTGTLSGITDGCTYTPDGTNNSIVFTNSRIRYNWLSFVDNVKNVFGVKNA